jgi:protein-histidine pros-kinase
MGLRLKFNLMLLAVALAGMLLFELASTPILQSLATDEVLQSSRIMMESALGARKYTSEQIAPILEPQMQTTFRPQAVSAYAAKKNFDVLRATYTDYVYREAALNPTNLEDRATDWEADVINDFRSHPDKKEIVLRRETPTGPTINLARPLVAKPACLVCHSTPAAAPQSMIAIYGNQNGFGWHAGDIVGAQIVSVPMGLAQSRADRVRTLFLVPYLIVFGMLFLLLNLLLDLMVIGPIGRMAKTAEAVSLGQMDAPEYVRGGGDQIAKLSRSINLMRRSLEEALRMLTDG